MILLCDCLLGDQVRLKDFVDIKLSLCGNTDSWGCPVDWGLINEA